MDSARPLIPEKLLSLQETAQQLAVSVDVLLNWNKHHILKPIITESGEITYTQEQINQFLTIQQSLQGNGIRPEKIVTPPSGQAGRAESEVGGVSSSTQPFRIPENSPRSWR